MVKRNLQEYFNKVMIFINKSTNIIDRSQLNYFFVFSFIPPLFQVKGFPPQTPLTGRQWLNSKETLRYRLQTSFVQLPTT